MKKNVTITGPCRLNLASNGSYQIIGGTNATVLTEMSAKDSVVFTVDLDAIRNAYSPNRGGKPAEEKSAPRKQRLILTYEGSGALTLVSNAHTQQFAPGKFGAIVDLAVVADDAVELCLKVLIPECPMPPCPEQDHYVAVLRLTRGSCGC